MTENLLQGIMIISLTTSPPFYSSEEVNKDFNLSIIIDAKPSLKSR